VGLVLTLILASVAIYQSIQANDRSNAAVASAKAAATAQTNAEAQQKEAETQKNIAFSRELAAKSQAQLAVDPNLALLLAIDAAKASQTDEAQAALQQALIATQPHNELHQPGVNVYNAAFSPDGSRVVTVGQVSTRIWEVNDRTGNTGNIVAELPNPGFFNRAAGSGILSGSFAAFSPDGGRIVLVTDQPAVWVWDIGTGAAPVRLGGYAVPVTTAQFSPDGKHILTASNDQTARIWDAATGKELVTMQGTEYIMNSAAFSPDGKEVATGSGNNVQVWDSSTGKLLQQLSGHSDVVNSVAFSPDGKRVVTASDDKTARIWDAATGKTLVTVSGHTLGVNQAEFSPDGNLVATTSRDAEVRIWDAATGKTLARIPESVIVPSAFTGVSDTGIVAVHFSPDGKRILLVTDGDDNAARIYPWDIFTPVDQLLPLASRLAPRQLSCEEKVTYLHENVVCGTPTAQSTP
jgi:WD40 repeat protein